MQQIPVNGVYKILFFLLLPTVFDAIVDSHIKIDNFKLQNYVTPKFIDTIMRYHLINERIQKWNTTITLTTTPATITVVNIAPKKNGIINIFK